jgi:hypothetical protein
MRCLSLAQAVNAESFLLPFPPAPSSSAGALAREAERAREIADPNESDVPWPLSQLISLLVWQSESEWEIRTPEEFDLVWPVAVPDDEFPQRGGRLSCVRRIR